jgi:adenylate kinase
MFEFKRLSIVLGSPGAGKDTQLKLLEQRQAAQVLYIGKAIREAAKTNKDIMQHMTSGGLVPNRIVNELFQLKLQQYNSTDWIVSDGFPRSVEQAVWLDQLLNQEFRHIDEVVLLEITDEEVRQRLSKRTRADDMNTIIEQRLNVYHTQTSAVIDHYETMNIIRRVDGIGNVEQVYQRLTMALGLNT